MVVARLILAVAVALAIQTPLLASDETQVCAPKRNSAGRIHRSSAARHAFARIEACPATGNHRLPCPGYRIDHIKPLKRCGADTPENMQWLTIEEWKAKTRWE